MKCRKCSKINISKQKIRDELKQTVKQEIKEEIKQEIKQGKRKMLLKCKDCNIDVSDKAERCEKCSRIFRRKVQNRPSLEQLENDLEELKHYTKVGEKYDVSCRTIRKWIKTYKEA